MSRPTRTLLASALAVALLCQAQPSHAESCIPGFDYAIFTKNKIANQGNAGTDQDELLAEVLAHLRHPLELHALRGDDQHPTHTPTGLQLADDQAGLDGLAEPNLVGEEQSDGVGGQRSFKRHHLMG